MRLPINPSHTPDTIHEKEDWEERHGWREIHHGDFPMLQTRFVESSCLKCHHAVTDVPQAKQLQAGYERISKYGCTGCHTIGGRLCLAGNSSLPEKRAAW